MNEMTESVDPSNPSDRDIQLLADQMRGGASFLHLCLSYSWGGLEQTAAEDALEIAGQGLKIRVACLQGSPLHEYLVHQEKETEWLTVVPLETLPREFLDLEFRKLILRQISEGVSVIHTQQIGLLWNVSPWLWSRPKIALFASRYLISEQDKRNVFQRAIYGRLDGLLVMSESLRRNVLATHPIRERRVRLVSPGLDFSKFAPEKVDPHAKRASWGADDQTKVIGLVGRIHPNKGQETFIKAAAGLLKESFSKKTAPLPRLKFVMVGEETLGSTLAHSLGPPRKNQIILGTKKTVIAGDHKSAIHHGGQIRLLSCSPFSHHMPMNSQPCYPTVRKDRKPEMGPSAI